ncbi:hypothetical protein [Hymenobacter arizonensis]|uniref:Uncharacterized protein n=1 Tax=Hymenobacter arizonensis TaxID=1227077 RepID=A0A1I6BI17_HYMAR|nr:hypothetical protein [Hymenobacter arizonensis]SFQ80427.1 hypothetical protein SAMN04515668_4580 [Hymenobacter arizonensis]
MLLPHVLSYCLLALVFGTVASFHFSPRRVGQGMATGCGLFLLTGCGGLPPENQRLKQQVVQAIRAVEDRPVGDSITVDMARIVDIPWDTLYMFTSTTGPERITRAIGTPWPGDTYVDDDDNLLVFMYQGRLADYVEFLGWNFQKEPNFVKFKGYFKGGELFTPATAKFRAIRNRVPPHIIDLHAPRGSKPILRPGYDPKKLDF